MPDVPWEYGSDFHAVDVPCAGTDVFVPPWAAMPASFWSVGRSPVAALTLLAGGRLFVPVYFCQEVVDAWTDVGVRVVRYEDGPHRAPGLVTIRELSDGDVVLTCGYFGVRSPPVLAVADGRRVTVVEDHTHDPWAPAAFASKADYCIASLRKSLPLPDGAVLWSPTGRDVPQPSEMSLKCAQAVLHRLSAMLLKSRYLSGEAVSKPVFRRSAELGEQLLGSVDSSEMSPYSRALLTAFPTRWWRDARRDNWRILSSLIPANGWFRILPAGGDDAPFSCVLQFSDSRRRDQVRAALIQRSVYSALLWSIGENVGPAPDALSFSSTMLSIPCDARYAVDDLRRVADALASLTQRP